MSEFELESIGKLSPHPDVPDEWLQSKEISIPFFDGKLLNFIFIGYEFDETFFIEANDAIINFLEKDANFRDEVSNSVFANYVEVFNEFGEDEGLPKVICEQDIWQYFYPKEIYVERRDRRDKEIYLYVACECDWEEEHGLQLVFRQGKKLTRVSSQDGHLTESDAYDKPDADDELLSKF